MDRRRWLGARTAILLVTAVAALSFVVGVINIASPGVTHFEQYIPESAQRVAGFTGAMTGFLMLTSVIGLRRGLRAAWYSTMALLPVTVLQGLVQGGAVVVPVIGLTIPVALPLIALSIISFPLVAINGDRFTQSWSLTTTQLAALSALVGAQIYGTAGTYALRAQFPKVDTVLDAFYFTLVTASTVGYGDISATTQVGRLFSMSVLLVGVASFGAAAGTLLGPAIEARFAAALGTMTDAQLSMLEDHIVVLGYGELTEPIIEELRESNVPFVVVTPDTDRATLLRNQDVNVLTADPSDEDPLHDAGIERAAGVLAATNDDAEDALAILTARELNPEVRIVAAATDRQNTEKLRRAGADTVISPSVIGGHLLVQSALGQHGVESVADRILGTSGDDVEEMAEETSDEGMSEETTGEATDEEMAGEAGDERDQ